MLWQTFAAHKWRRKEQLSQDSRQPQQACLERSTRDTCTGKFRPRQRVTSAAIHATRTLGKPSKRLKQLRRLVYPRGPNPPVTLRQMQNKWRTQKAEEIHRFADTNDTQKFYEALKTIYGPTQHAYTRWNLKTAPKSSKIMRVSCLAMLNILMNYSLNWIFEYNA